MKPEAGPAKTGVALLALAVGLTACASAGRDGGAPAAEPQFVVGSNGWISGALRPADPEADQVGCHSASRNLALRADDPWFGTIGLRQALPGDCELGVGIALPTSYFGTQRAASVSERPGNLGVGVWLKFEF